MSGGWQATVRRGFFAGKRRFYQPVSEPVMTREESSRESRAMRYNKI